MQNSFYDQTIKLFKQSIQNSIDNRIANLKPSRNHHFSISIAIEALEAINILNSSVGTKIFLMGGGLLGALRENKLLAHDYDLDLGFFIDDFSIKQMKEIFNKAKDFQLVSATDTIILVSYKNIKIDLFGHYFIDKNTVRLSTNIHNWDHDMFELKKISFLGTEVLIPKDANKYLTECYGDWRNKKIGYDFSYDSPNRTYNGFYGILYLIERLGNVIIRNYESYISIALCALYRNYNIDYRHIYPMPTVEFPKGFKKKESIIFVTKQLEFSLELLQKLKDNYIKNKNFFVIIIEEKKSIFDIVSIVGKLSFVDQVFHFNHNNTAYLDDFFSDSKYIYDDNCSVDMISKELR